MNTDQGLLFTILAVIMGLLMWGRWRYDLVAFGGLVVTAVLGLLDAKEAFAGFGHPATVVIALVLIISRGLSNAGVVDLLTQGVARVAKNLVQHIFLMSGLAAGLSAVMNNVAALALLMPVDLQAAKKAKRSASLTLMPLSFASILGGMVTLIGTPPNIIIAAFREETAAAAPFSMFDFAPVGVACAVAGVVFVALVGWRLVPRERTSTANTGEFDLENYVAEARVSDEAKIIGQKVRELDDLANDHEIEIVGLVRGRKRQPGMARHVVVLAGDVLIVEGGPQDIQGFIEKVGLVYEAADGLRTPLLTTEDVAVVEVVIPPGARIAGRSTKSLQLKQRFGVHLLGVSRRGKRIRKRLRHVALKPGDVLLLQGNRNELPEVTRWLGCLPLAVRNLPTAQRRRAFLASSIFAAAILLATTNVLYLPVALAVAVVAMVGLGIVPLRDVYDNVEWPVIVLIASMIPIGTAMQTTGATEILGDGIVTLSQGWSPVVVLTLIMVLTMTLSDVMNNTATAVMVAPLAVDVATRLKLSPDPFLMAVAVASSCAFLTPIGHKNNTLILGPGGYRFGDYWRMGLPLEVIVVVVGVPMILWVWPLALG